MRRIIEMEYNYKKYFIPEKEGKYSIKLKFKINISKLLNLL